MTFFFFGFSIMANLQLRIDDDLRDRAQAVAEEMGLDLTTAVRMFLHQMVRCRGLPFQPTASPALFPENAAAAAKSDEKDADSRRSLVE